MSANLVAHLDLEALAGETSTTSEQPSKTDVEHSKPLNQKRPQTTKGQAASTDTQSIRISLPSGLVKRLALLRIAGTSRNKAIKDAVEIYLENPEVQKLIAQVSKSLK